MNKCLLFCLFVSFYTVAYAQSFTVTPNPVYGEADLYDLNTDPDDVIAHASIANNTSGALNLRWERIVNDKPECWETAVCDVDLCYFYTVNTVDFLLAPDVTEGEMLVHAYSGGAPGEEATGGEAYVVVKITNLDDPTDTVRVEYNFTVNGSSACVTSISEAEKEALKIYPNPTTDFFYLTDTQEIKELVVYNILGNQVKVFEVNGNQKFNISDLPDGVYVVGMIDRDREIVKTVKLQKY